MEHPLLSTYKRRPPPPQSFIHHQGRATQDTQCSKK
jgi:hypothetical protein